MLIRPATVSDIPAMMQLFENARKFMYQSGNLTQWKSDYPSTSIIEDDIKNGTSYVCVENGVVEGTFMLMTTEEPTYAEIQGAWMNERQYGTIHRIASSGNIKRLTDAMINYCLTVIPELRGDTHADNVAMQNAFERNGFRYCGIVTVRDGTLRRAYQRVAKEDIS